MNSEKKIPFNLPPVLGNEKEFVLQAIDYRKLSGDGTFNKRSADLIKEKLGSKYVNLTPSCTAALEMAYLIIDLKPEEEVILPSYTFTSTATAVTLFGAKPVFVDIDESLNLDCSKLESAITPRTKAICIVHYAGMSCDFERLTEITKKSKNRIFIIEDAAQGIDAYYKNKPLGCLGDISAFSFHETKNIVCGEGGAIAVNDSSLVERAEILKDKGTNRQRFLRGQVDKYTWQDKGSSYLLGELSAAYLYAQLLESEKITHRRLEIWNRYYSNLAAEASKGNFKLPVVPSYSRHNGHIFYLIVKSQQERDSLFTFLKKRGVTSAPHYEPLHSSPAGVRFGKVSGDLKLTNELAGRLLRLPLFLDLSNEDIDFVSGSILEYYSR